MADAIWTKYENTSNPEIVKVTEFWDAGKPGCPFVLVNRSFEVVREDLKEVDA